MRAPSSLCLALPALGLGCSGSDEGESSDEEATAEVSERCTLAMDRLEASGRTELRISGDLWKGDSVTFVPIIESREGRSFEQFNRFDASLHARSGRDYFECVDGTVLLARYDRPEAEVAELFLPPLPWTKVPLEPGDSWRWTGRYEQGCPGRDTCSIEAQMQDAEVDFAVGETTTLSTPMGQIPAIPVESSWTFGGQLSFTQTTWFHAHAQLVIVQRVRDAPASEGSGLSGRWTLRSIENPPAAPE